MRYIGMFMPRETIFKRIVWRFYQLLFLQIFLSAYTEVIKSTVISDEKTNMDGLSLIMAYFAIVITVPFVIHMLYGINEYIEFLEDDDILESLGHYYTDLNIKNRKINVALYHLVFIFRRILFTIIIVNMSKVP